MLAEGELSLMAAVSITWHVGVARAPTHESAHSGRDWAAARAQGAMEFWTMALQTKLVEYLAYKSVVLERLMLLHPKSPMYLHAKSALRWSDAERETGTLFAHNQIPCTGVIACQRFGYW